MIYILTFHGSVNYGAVMQGYALYKKVTELAGDCLVIDYNRLTHHRNYIRMNLKAGNWKSRLLYLIKMSDRISLSRKFNQFVLKYIKLTEPFNGYESLLKSTWNKNDVYLLGSDQVLNIKMTGDDYHYYLDFIDSPNKIAYAPSFGVSELGENTDSEKCGDLLKRFLMLTVREESGQKIIRELIGIEPDVVVDPTLLLTKEEWLKIAKYPKVKGKYVLVFRFHLENKLYTDAEAYAVENNMTVVNICYMASPEKNAVNLRNLSPEEWIGYFSCAEKIFTDSFHGLTFSLIFRKQFEISLAPSGNQSRNSRLTNLLDRIGIDYRSCEPIDYTVADERIESERRKSLEKLSSMLQSVTDKGGAT